MPTIDIPQASIASYSIGKLNDEEERAQKLVKTIPNIDSRTGANILPSISNFAPRIKSSIKDMRDFSDSYIKTRHKAMGVKEGPLPIFDE